MCCKNLKNNLKIIYIYSFQILYIYIKYIYTEASQVTLVVKNPPADTRDARIMNSIPGQDDPLEKGMAAHSNILA